MEEGRKSLFDIITEYSVNEGMDEMLCQNRDYGRIQDEIEEQAEQLDMQGLTREQRQMVDRLVCAHTESGAVYGRLAYKRGFKEGIHLLRELGMLKAS